MSKRVWGIVFLGIWSFVSYGQAPGLVVQTGLSSAWVADDKVTPSGQMHTGYAIGADARLLSGSMYFLVGAQYHAIQFTPHTSYQLTGGDWKILMGRFGLGFDLIHFADNFAIRSKLLASINLNMSTPDGGLNIEGYNNVNEAYFGATTGLGVTIGPFDVDLDYQYGLVNTFFEKPKTKVNHLSLIAGFHF